MKKIDVTLRMGSNGKKITLIKAVRHCLGLGLTEAKAFVEDQDRRLNWGDVAGPLTIRVNDQQFGRLCAYTFDNSLIEHNGPVLVVLGAQVVNEVITPPDYSTVVHSY